jgi:hypothetical protein
MAMPTIMAFGRELRLPCYLFVEAPPDKEQSTTDYVAVIVDRLHDIHPGPDLQLWGPRSNQNVRLLSVTTNLGYTAITYE